MLIDIVTCFESNEERVSLINDACKKRGYETMVITSDFSHIRKELRANKNSEFVYLKTRPYSRNMSIGRIRSHIQFARDAFKLIEEQEPDLIWLVAPANSLIAEANKYKKKNNKVKLIIDIIDMWPESLPFDYNKHLFPFSIWRDVRRNNIECADTLVTECNLYREILKEEYKKNIKTIYWAKDTVDINNNPDLPSDKLSFCYIGSINNIIDIDRIYDLIDTCDKPVELHIVGEGEKTNGMINRLEKVCSVTYHGAIRDEKEKNKIFNKCHAGINIYKEGLYIGLTVKCIDYFKYGLPIINNIKGDTWNFVETNKVGVNINKNTKIKSEEIENLRINNQNIFGLFNENFTKEVFEKRCLETIDEVLK